MNSTSAPGTMEGSKSNSIYLYEKYIDQYKETTIHMSSSLINRKIEQYKQGKCTEKYIRTYLDMALLENVINNLKYLEVLEKLNEMVK